MYKTFEQLYGEYDHRTAGYFNADSITTYYRHPFHRLIAEFIDSQYNIINEKSFNIGFSKFGTIEGMSFGFDAAKISSSECIRFGCNDCIIVASATNKSVVSNNYDKQTEKICTVTLTEDVKDLLFNYCERQMKLGNMNRRQVL